MKLVICLLFFISTFTDSNGEIKQRCSNKTLLCFLCGCEKKSDFKITCKENHVIQMEPSKYVMREGDSDSDKDCPIDKYKKCKKSIPAALPPLQDRIDVYKNCTFKNSCEVNFKERIKTGNKRWVNYPFICHDKSAIRNISSKLEKQITNPVFYFTVEEYTGKKIDCDCSVTGSTLIRLDIFFIHLTSRTCLNLKFLSETHQLFGCSTNDTTTLFHTSYYDIGTDFKLEIRGMEPDVEDVLFFRVTGKNLTVNCSGCTNSTDTVTTVHPTRDVPAPAASTDQTNNVIIATLGGILAAVIIINIVGIALYCFIRRRKKQQKSRNTLTNAASRNGEQSQYNYIDTTLDAKGSSHTNRTESYVVQNDDQRKHPHVNALENMPKMCSSKDQPKNQYHVLEIDTYSAPANTRAGADSKHMPGKGRRKQDDYDHINDGSKSKPTNGDNYNHIDATMAVPRDATPDKTTPYDDYNHIGDQNGLSKDKLKPKEKNQVSGNENTSYVNVNLEPDETPTSTEDVDTYNHLQN